MLRRVLIINLILLVLAVPQAASAPEQVTLPGGAVLEIVKIQNPPLDTAGKARIAGIKSVVIVPSAVSIDTIVLTGYVEQLKQKTGWTVYTPREFMRAAAEIGEMPTLEGGLTETEQNSIVRKVAGRLTADSGLLSSLRPGDWKYYPSLLPVLLGHRWEQTGIFSMRLVGVTSESALWSQSLEYKVTLQVRGLAAANPPYPSATDIAAALVQKMIERFIADAR